MNPKMEFNASFTSRLFSSILAPISAMMISFIAAILPSTATATLSTLASGVETAEKQGQVGRKPLQLASYSLLHPIVPLPLTSSS
jgi:hypothetical protein